MAGCADVCLSVHDDADTPDFFSVKTVTAKKTYRCVECGDWITPGMRYERTSGKWHGCMETYPTCLPCADVRDAFTCGSWVYGELWNDVLEQMFPVWREKGAWDCLAKLQTPEAVAKCNAAYAEWLRDWYGEELPNA